MKKLIEIYQDLIEQYASGNAVDYIEIAKLYADNQEIDLEKELNIDTSMKENSFFKKL